MWGNTKGDPPSLYNYSGCSAGPGCINEDPLFVDAPAGDYHLELVSLCINAGDNGAPGLPATDLDGYPRISGGSYGRVDMGVYEATDVDAICIEVGVEIDEELPPTDPYKNHGHYVSQVVHAANDILEGYHLTDAEYDAIHSCVVSTAAESDVGKRNYKGGKKNQ